MKFNTRQEYLLLVRLHEKSLSVASAEYYKWQIDELIFQRHFGSNKSLEKRNYIFAQLLSDLPWSFGTFFPERIKRKARPIRNSWKELFKYLHPKSAKELKKLFYEEVLK